jgi:GNAT superfamily N-acetyltransferase
MNDEDVVQLQQAQLASASEIAAKAFDDDPVFGYLTAHDRKLRFQALTWLMSRAIAYCAQHKYVYTTSNLAGIAAWLPPGSSAIHPLQLLQMIWQLQLYTLPWQVGWHRLGQWLKVFSTIEQAHRQDMGNSPHWYLAIMAVHPKYQGKGIGSRLLQPILQQASDQELPCYLVTFTKQAVRFYQKNGFEIVRHQKLSASALPFWALKRNS